MRKKPISDPGVEKAPDADPQHWVSVRFFSVGDPDPQDPHVFGPPGTGSISQRCGSGSGSLPFLINLLSELK
jgi:hypothetical protein